MREAMPRKKVFCTKPFQSSVPEGMKTPYVPCRNKALGRLQDLLAQGHILSEDVYQLILSHQFYPDDLTESGIPYEIVRALELKYPQLLSKSYPL